MIKYYIPEIVRWCSSWHKYSKVILELRFYLFHTSYDDIRELHGFKNVSLGNILNAKSASEKITFLNEVDKSLFEKYRGVAFEVQVGIHELLGNFYFIIYVVF